VVSASLEAVAVGGSAGALDALTALLAGLPAGWRTSILLVVHIRPEPPSLLPDVLAARTRLDVREARDKEPIAPATIYVAPPDYHLLVERERTLSLSRDPAVHYTRPAIDILFESAASAFGPSLAGVLLTGANADGARGLAAIRAAGGRVAVQDPATAVSPVMPAAGLAALAALGLAADCTGGPPAIATWLGRIAAEASP
jgi:two-component system, chemotaxis family, protein-glutamate methylesterase/glutaminase